MELPNGANVSNGPDGTNSSNGTNGTNSTNGRNGTRERVSLPESPYRARLIEEVQRKLRKAVESSSSNAKQELMRQLFTDVVFEVDTRAQGLLYGDTQPQNPIPSGGEKTSTCFYEILAEHYAQKPEDGDALLPLFSPLWSSPFTSQIFTLLLHQWLFETPAAHAEEIQRYSRAFINGVGDILWIDVQSNVRRFRPLFMFVMHDIVFSPKHLSRVPAQAQRDLVQLLCRFYFFYESGVKLGLFIHCLPTSIGNPFVGGTADVFATELTNQLHKIKVEPVLLQYLECSRALKGIELRTTTSIRLQVALYSMASPGGPLFPTRAVRQTAKLTLDHLYPVGRRFRHIISLVFRILHPAYWPGSFFNFVKTSIESLYDWSIRMWYIPPRQHVQKRWFLCGSFPRF